MSGVARPGMGAPADWLALTKPGITAMSLLMALGALVVAPVTQGPWRSLLALMGIALLVGAANAFNMILERVTDGLMERTRTRPLPSGRMRAMPGLVMAVVFACCALAMLLVFGNLLTFALGLVALVLYVGVYTPLKYRTPAALLVGAIPGAMPVLLGSTAATGRIEPFGFGLFAVLAAWQVPHFLAISLFRRSEYERAGIRIVPVLRGDDAARRETFAYTLALLPISFALVPLGAGAAFGIAAALGGAWLTWLSWRGLRRDANDAGARRYFRATLLYLPTLVLGLALDRVLA